MVDEAGAVEEHIDRPDLAREGLNRLGRANVELALVCVEAFEAGDVDVSRNDARPFSRKGLGRPSADARRSRRQQRHLTRQSSRHTAAPSYLDPRPSPWPPGRASRRHRGAFLAGRWLAAGAAYCQDGKTGIDSGAVQSGAVGAASLDGAAIAQLVEHVIRNDGVRSSNLSCGTNLLCLIKRLRSNALNRANGMLVPIPNRYPQG